MERKVESVAPTQVEDVKNHGDLFILSLTLALLASTMNSDKQPLEPMNYLVLNSNVSTRLVLKSVPKNNQKKKKSHH